VLFSDSIKQLPAKIWQEYPRREAIKADATSLPYHASAMK
jgi:hypothetical protein